MQTKRLIGIDFSGDAQQWSANKQKSNVWVAVATTGDSQALFVESLKVVQELPGSEHPFERLITFLSSEPYAAAGIDAPFSVPSAYLPQTYSNLLEAGGTLERNGRPFPRGHQLIDALVPQLIPRGKKVWRRTESEWRERGVNVRSTLWNGPRGGAPFTVACLAILSRCKLPIWPWSAASDRSLVEAFPAAQLQWWNLPFTGYNGSTTDAIAARKAIIRNLYSRGLRFSSDMEAKMLDSADSLDAVICLYAARAVAEHAWVTAPHTICESEGWIAVHR